ncbi:MAG: MFS transporter [Candidatus Helarchaeota archaeon]
MGNNLKKDLWTSIYIPFAAGMSASGTLIPLFLLSLPGGSVSFIGLFSSITSIVSLILTFIWGKLTDDTGKRKIFILISMFSGFGILMGYAFSFEIFHLMWLAIISGLLLGAESTATSMYLFDHYPPDLWEEKISKLNLKSGIGSCIGMVFGALFQMYFLDYQLFFIITSILCLISGIMGFFLLHDKKPEKMLLLKREFPIVGILDLPIYSSLLYKKVIYSLQKRDSETKGNYYFTKYVVIFLIAIFIFYLSSSLTFTPLSAFMKINLNINDSWIFWIFLSYYVILTISFLFVGNAVDKYGNRKMLFLGLSLRIVTYILFTVFSMITLSGFNGLLSLIIIAGIAGFSISFIKVVFSNIYPRLFDNRENLGEMLAVFSIIGGLAGIIGSYLSGYIAELTIYGYFLLFLTSTILAGLSLLIFFLVKKLK